MRSLSALAGPRLLPSALFFGPPVSAPGGHSVEAGSRTPNTPCACLSSCYPPPSCSGCLYRVSLRATQDMFTCRFHLPIFFRRCLPAGEADPKEAYITRPPPTTELSRCLFCCTDFAGSRAMWFHSTGAGPWRYGRYWWWPSRVVSPYHTYV